MILIAHRGNTNGPNPSMENNPEYINTAISMGFDAEVDVWLIDGKFFLGHDEPKYETDRYFLSRSGLWCHAKNIDALSSMIMAGIHCFWHQEDNYTLTSKGYIWSYPGSTLSPNSINVLPEWSNEINKLKFLKTDEVYGICTDYPLLIKD